MKEEDSLTGGVPMDDYVACNITRKEDWVDLYAKPYYFGCEADDRMNAVAFGKGMPFSARNQCHLQLGYRPFRRAGHAAAGSRGL